MNTLKRIITVVSLPLLAFILPACGSTNSVAVDGYPESIAENDDFYYVAVIGKTMSPTKKDGDGFIMKINRRGGIVSANAFPGVKLNAPKGAVVEDDVIYVADIDRVVGINVRTGMQVATYDLSKTGTSFLNDIAEDDGLLYVSARDINKIFVINVRSGSYEELKTSEPLKGPNGLDIEDHMLYVAEYAIDNSGKPAGKIKAISLRGPSPRSVSVVWDTLGQYDGIKFHDEEPLLGGRDVPFIYFSDWEMNGKKGAVKKLNLNTKEIEDVITIPVNGPADFIIEDGVVWLPAMLDKKIVIK